jgi:SRSO17 transposase
MSEMTAEWEAELEALHGRIAPCFSRSEPRKRALGYLKGLLSQCERKNGWQLAEQLGELNPDGVQRLLNQADWQSEQVMRALRGYVVEQIGSPEGMLIVDETGFLKKGDQSAGVQRQYSGTAGRVENCQVGVFLTYAAESGSAFIDRRLYLPKDWLEDRQRSKLAGIPKQTKFATKPELARQMIQTAMEEKVPFKWVSGDSIYGGDRKLRRWLEEQEVSFVLAVPKNEALWYEGFKQLPASEIAQKAEPKDWHRLSAGEGAKGPRLYDWAVVPLWRLQVAEEAHLGHYLLLRRSLEDPTDIAYYVVFARREDASLEQLVKVAGQRWNIEQGFELAKGECGLEHYEVRKWQAWYRHITLALLAHAFLVAVRAKELKKTVTVMN